MYFILFINDVLKMLNSTQFFLITFHGGQYGAVSSVAD